MSEEIKKEEVKNEEVEMKQTQNVKTEENAKKTKKMKKRTLFVLVVLAIFIIGSLIVYRADYIETLEIGEEYTETFLQNVRYKINIGIVNFIVIFTALCITNSLIKKGLKQFFEEEKKEMPKLPNKSISLAIALISSIIVSNLFLEKVILFLNAGEFGIADPFYNMDVGFYMFKAPLIGQILYYGVIMLVILTIYTVVYYIVTFNKFFDGINGQTLRNNTFIKQLLWNAMLIILFIAGIILFNMQNLVTGPFLTLDDRLDTSLIGAGVADGIKLWGYRIFAVILVLAVYIAIKAFKKNNTKKVMKSLATIPIYLVGLFVVLVGYNMIFVKSSELDKQKEYISKNIEFTKTAYDIKIGETELTNTGTITEKEAEENQDVIANIPIITEEIARNNLLQTQTSTGYYTYNNTKVFMNNGNLTYIAARELDDNHKGDEYTHGYGAVITSATETDEAGNIEYVSREFENKDITEPRIYYGVENKRSSSCRKWKSRI